MQHFCRRQHPAPAAHPETSTYPLLRLYRGERTSGTYALLVHIRPGAGDLATFHSNTPLLAGKLYRFKDCKI